MLTSPGTLDPTHGTEKWLRRGRYRRHAARPALAAALPTGRAPIYREGDSYALDPYDDDLDLWLFRPGLRRPKAPFLKIERPQAEPLPGPDQPLTTAELDKA